MDGLGFVGRRTALQQRWRAHAKGTKRIVVRLSVCHKGACEKIDAGILVCVATAHQRCGGDEMAFSRLHDALRVDVLPVRRRKRRQPSRHQARVHRRRPPGPPRRSSPELPDPISAYFHPQQRRKARTTFLRSLQTKIGKAGSRTSRCSAKKGLSVAARRMGIVITRSRSTKRHLGIATAKARTESSECRMIPSTPTQGAERSRSRCGRRK